VRPITSFNQISRLMKVSHAAKEITYTTYIITYVTTTEGYIRMCRSSLNRRCCWKQPSALLFLTFLKNGVWISATKSKEHGCLSGLLGRQLGWLCLLAVLTHLPTPLLSYSLPPSHPLYVALVILKAVF